MSSRVKETIPVESGARPLLYPKWLPGSHSPTGRIDALAGLEIDAHGKRVEWLRAMTTLDIFDLLILVGDILPPRDPNDDDDDDEDEEDDNEADDDREPAVIREPDEDE